MSIEDVIRAWKTGEESLNLHLPASPVGRELDEQELVEVIGGCNNPSTHNPLCAPNGVSICQVTR